MPPKAYDPNATSTAVGGDKKKRGGWLWWLLGLLLLAAIIAALLLSGGDDDEEAGAAPAPATQTTAPATTQAAAAATSSASLTAGSAALLGTGATTIGDHVGETATGEGLQVISVEGSGFFVGTDKSDRQFVEFGSRVGAEEAEPYAPKVGDTVSLSGPVRPAPEDPATTLKLGADTAQVVTDRGAYINAETVTPAG